MSLTFRTVKALSAHLKSEHNVSLLSLFSLNESNPKGGKTFKKLKIVTAILYLDPGYSPAICPNAGYCRLPCLNGSGNPGHDSAKEKARFARSKLAMENPQLWIFSVVVAIARLRKNSKGKIAVRLNGTSDLVYTSRKYKLLVTEQFKPLLKALNVRCAVGKAYSIFELFPGIQFYDYTKNASVFGREPKNYHLTFSLDGALNVDSAIALYNRGYSIAAAFESKTLPESLTLVGTNESVSIPVYDADKHDYRPIDPLGIAGLTYKKPTGTSRHKLAQAESLGNPFLVKGDTIRQNVELIAVAS